MTCAYVSLGPFGSRVNSKSMGHNTYTDRRINLRSNITPTLGQVHKSDLNYSYSRSHKVNTIGC